MELTNKHRVHIKLKSGDEIKFKTLKNYKKFLNMIQNSDVITRIYFLEHTKITHIRYNNGKAISYYSIPY